MKPSGMLRRRQQRMMTRVRLFQISGIALITLSVMNGIFRPAIGLEVNMFLMLVAAAQLWFSYWLWERARRRMVCTSGQ